MITCWLSVIFGQFPCTDHVLCVYRQHDVLLIVHDQHTGHAIIGSVRLQPSLSAGEHLLLFLLLSSVLYKTEEGI